MQLFSSWTGSDFLLFYSMLLGMSALAAWWMPHHLRSTGRRNESTDVEHLAWLAGGRVQHTDAVIADLYARGGLMKYADGKLHVVDPGLSASPSGRALLTARKPISGNEADRLLAVHAGRIAVRLRREGLMLREDELARLRWLSIAPLIMLFVIGLYRQRAGSALGEPTEFLIILLGVTIAFAVVRFAWFDKRTIAGIETVDQMRRQSSRLRSAPRPGEAALAVALFGTGVLIGTPWEPVHALRQQGSGDGSGTDGGGDGGSGCGGGGCGGCGG